MGQQPEAAAARSDARAQRRWLIGLTITVVFGLFGAVMALLAYTNGNSARRSREPAGTAVPAPGGAPATSPPVPDEPGGKGHGKDHDRK